MSMDFAEGLPRTGHANCILVVVDKFSKFAHFIPMLHPFTAASVAKLFLDNIYRLHGMPSHIISDRGRIFTSSFWRELFKLAKTTLCMSSAYHPQSYGQTERVNQCLETYLRCFVHSCLRKWLQWLSLAKFWYNSVYTRPWVGLRLRCYTDILHATSAYLRSLQQAFQNWTRG